LQRPYCCFRVGPPTGLVACDRFIPVCTPYAFAHSVTEAPSVPTKVVTETQDKKKKKKTKAKDSKNERQISEFDRKLDVLSKFEDRLTDRSLTSMENWQKVSPVIRQTLNG
jgi:hypothetical protein